jgi:uncharacterized protein
MMKEKRPFNIMVFPVGPICNLACKYCYYLNKTSLYPETKDFRMSEELLEEFIKQYIDAQPGPIINFGWQGGEPTLRGIDFFRKAVELEKKYLPEGWQFINSFQTNGVLLNPEWCDFLRENNFLVGISIDGPADLHDAYRVDQEGKPSHERVLNGLHLLQEHHVEYNILCVVNDVNVSKPLEVYNFFKQEGVKFIQFIPLVEHLGQGKVSSRSINGEEYGQFLTAIFDEWIINDLGDIFVQIFEEAVAAWAGYGAGLCVFSETCGLAPVMEHNGDLYSCDHFVFPEYKLGNIWETPIKELVNSPQQREFGLSKRDALPEVCKKCDVRFICNGGCLRNRIATTEDGEPGLNYLCTGYKQFFSYIDKYMKELIPLLKRRTAPSLIRKKMKTLHDVIWDVDRNDYCPCGSGKKYKKCCMERKSK